MTENMQTYKHGRIVRMFFLLVLELSALYISWEFVTYCSIQLLTHILHVTTYMPIYFINNTHKFSLVINIVSESDC